MEPNFGFQLITFIGGLVILIILHELGHFVAARSLKIEVEEFGIGFPPRAAKMFRLWGTDFTLNWIPLGGFVRPHGENDPAIAGGLAAAPPWKRLIVLFAGPVTNLVIGIIIGVILFYSAGKPITNQVLIGQVMPNSPAEQAGLLAGDLIISINGTQVNGNEMLKSIVDANLGKTITLAIARGQETVTVELTPRLNPPENEGAMGIIMTHPVAPVTLGEAFTEGVGATFENVRGLLALPVRMIQGEAAPEEGRLVGYRGMFEIYRQVVDPLWFFMAISISLGVLNLLPIPALDGGRILLILPELLFKRRIPPQYENAIHMVGFALLIILLIYVNVQDFINPIQLPK